MVDCALLHRWHSKLEEFCFVVKHRRGKSQKHVDDLFRAPVHPAEGEEELGLCTLTQLLEHAHQELQEINEQTQRVDENRQGLVSLEFYCFDKQGRIVVGPAATHHLMHLLDSAAVGHLGNRKLLAKFQEWYTYLMERKITEETTRTCAGCQQGTDYRPHPPPMGHITAEKPWHTDIMGPF